MKRIIVGVFVLLVCTTVNAQIRTSKRGEMLGNPVFSIENKSKNDFISRNVSDYLQIEDGFRAALFTIKEVSQVKSGLTVNYKTYKTGKILANQISLSLKMSKFASGLFLDKNGALKKYNSLSADPDAKEESASLMYVETCKGEEYVRFYRANVNTHLDANNKIEYKTLTDIKYMTIEETSEGSRIVFKDQPDGDKSMWKLYRIQ